MRTILKDRSRKGQAWVGTAIIAALIVGALLGTSLATRTDAAAQPTLTFSGQSALLLSYVAADKTADFEQVIRTYGDALGSSEDDERKRQAAGLRMFRAAEPGANNTVLYVWLVDPVVSGGNYAVAQVLADEMPADVQGLYEVYVASLESGGQQPINMDLVMEF